MSSEQPMQIEGFLPSGELDFAWLAKNNTKTLSPVVAKKVLSSYSIKFVSAHGKKLRFSKRFSGKLVRFNVGVCSFQEISKSATQLSILQSLSFDELHELKQKAQKAKVPEYTLTLAKEEFLANACIGLCESTILGYKSDLNRIVRDLGHIPIEKICHDDVETWLVTCLKSRKYAASSTIKDTLSMLDRVLKRAASQKRITPTNIDFGSLKTINARFIPRDKSVKDTKTLSPAELKGLDELDDSILEEHGLRGVRNMMLLAATCLPGRSGEHRALALEDIAEDQNGRFSNTIDRSCVLEKFKEPKTSKKSLATIEIFEHAVPYLERLIQDAKQYSPQQIETRLNCQDIKHETVTFLLVNPKTGTAYTEAHYRDAVKEVQRLAGIQSVIPPKQLRHTGANYFNQAGIDVRDYFGNLTHCNHQTTMEFYGGQMKPFWQPKSLHEVEETLTSFNRSIGLKIEEGDLPQTNHDAKDLRYPKVRLNVTSLGKIRTSWSSSAQHQNMPLALLYSSPMAGIDYVDTS